MQIFPESQSVSGWKGPQCVIWSKLRLSQGHPRAHSTGLHPDGSCVSPVRETAQETRGQLVPVLSHCSVKFFLIFRWSFMCMSFCPLSLSYCLALPRRAWLHLLNTSLETLVVVDGGLLSVSPF